MCVGGEHIFILSVDSPAGCLLLFAFVCLFVLRLYIPDNNFSVMSGRSQHFLGLTRTVVS